MYFNLRLNRQNIISVFVIYPVILSWDNNFIFQLHNSSLKQQVSDLQDQMSQVQQTIEQWSASYYAKDAEVFGHFYLI